MDASGNLIDAGETPGGVHGGTPAYISLIAGPDTTKTITGATHGYATAGLLVQVYDNASPRNAIAAGWTVNASTFDVIITFASASPTTTWSSTGPRVRGLTGLQSLELYPAALTVPAEFSVSGSPATTSGTLAVSRQRNLPTRCTQVHTDQRRHPLSAPEPGRLPLASARI
jgi:hypothetical protein